MRPYLCFLLLVTCTYADESEDRRSKLPFVADAVGNTLPPPSNLPATVGSPVNLLTPDRYEFYTFDESGELVKRLMTLEEIQAIVAAGEETEGLVTFANDNQPTIAFNFSQPPYTKVHSVVTNVQNVLKAQMEAHKNKPLTQPTLDTPDVSDSWSLILPSIFGNTGVDIVPDKSSGGFMTPETETIELDRPEDNNSLSKEGSNHVGGTTNAAADELKEIPITEKTTDIVRTNPTTLKTTTTSTTTTTTQKPTTTKKAPTVTSTASSTTKPTQKVTTTAKPVSSTVKQTTTSKPSTTTRPRITTPSQPRTTTNQPRSTTSRPRTTTSQRPTTTSEPNTTSSQIRTTTSQPHTTTSRPRQTTTQPYTTTTTKSRTTTLATSQSTKTILKATTTVKPTVTTKRQPSTTQKHNEPYFTRVQVQTLSNTAPTEKSTIHYEKISTYLPISTVTYVTERATNRPVTVSTAKTTVAHTTKRVPVSTKASSTTTVKVSSSVTTRKPPISTTTGQYSSTARIEEYEKLNATTITTQSVSPTTTVSSTENISLTKVENKPPQNENANSNNDESDLPLFDISESISQIASDLGGNYRPLPTSSDLIDTTRFTEIGMESKENVEIDIPADAEKDGVKSSSTTEKSTEHYVRISTLEPHRNDTNPAEKSKTEIKSTFSTTEKLDSTTKLITTTIDPILSGSMEDLLSQVVNQAPQNIVEPDQNSDENNKGNSTAKIPEETVKITSEKPTSTNVSNNIVEKNEINTETPLKRETTTKIVETKPQTTDVKTNILNNNIPPIDIKNKEEPNKGKEHEKTIITDKKNPSEEFNEKVTAVKKLPSNITYEKLNLDTNNNTSKNETVNNKHENAETEKRNEHTENEDTNNFTTKPPQVMSVGKEPSKLPQKLENISKPPIKNNQNATKSNPPLVENKESIKINDNITHNHKEKEETIASETTPKIDDLKKKFQKVNIDDKELANERNNSWKLISTVSPPKSNEISKDKLTAVGLDSTTHKDIVLEFPKENQGLEATTKNLGEDIAQFTELCNELAFRYWQAMIEHIDKKRSFVLSPYSITSMLAMMFMGARGSTSGEMNEILKLDDMVTFNPHFTLKNISDSIETSPESGIIVSAFIRELFTDRNKGKVLTFYKERAQHFYNGHVEEINFKLISDIIRRRTNLLVKRYTWGRIIEYMKSNSITMQPPLAAFSANIFQTDCSGSSVEGRDGEMYFVVSPNVRQRRLVPVPAVVYRSGFLAGYDPVLDATAAALGNTNSIVSTLFVMPGQQGNVVHADDLEKLEKRLLENIPTTPAWNSLLRTLLPRVGLELQIPRFSHKSIFNVSSTLRQMGLRDLFDADHADLGGLNGPSKDLYLSDMVQQTTFVTCGEGVVADQHHIEEYPDRLEGPQRKRTSRWVNVWDEPRDYQRAFHDPHDVGDAMYLPLHLRPRQARVPGRDAQPARLKFDRPFLFFVRHNPSGMILYVGRYNPRLLP